LARPAGTGDADDRHLVARTGDDAPYLLGLRFGTRFSLEHRDGARDESVVARAQRSQLVLRLVHRGKSAEHVLDHPGDPESPPVLGRVDLLDPVPLEGRDLVGRDRAAAADYYADVLVAALAQHVDHVGEILVVSALVGADGDRVGVLVDGGAHDIGDAAVVAEVHHFRTARLQQAPDHVYGGVVAVNQRGGRDEAQRRPGRGLLTARKDCAALETGVHVLLIGGCPKRLDGLDVYPRVGY